MSGWGNLIGLCFMVCGLLGFLWERSYWYLDRLQRFLVQGIGCEFYCMEPKELVTSDDVFKIISSACGSLWKVCFSLAKAGSVLDAPIRSLLFRREVSPSILSFSYSYRWYLWRWVWIIFVPLLGSTLVFQKPVVIRRHVFFWLSRLDFNSGRFGRPL